MYDIQYVVRLIGFTMLLQGECDPSFGAEFEFSLHKKELVIGEVFVRIYNEQPTFPLEVRLHLVGFQNTFYLCS